jgi:NADP-dependent 3-hydroxy acid dehydrogenase YdfG
MAKQQRILTGQVAAITGAARGIGRATACGSWTSRGRSRRDDL